MTTEALREATESENRIKVKAFKAIAKLTLGEIPTMTDEEILTELNRKISLPSKEIQR